MNMRWKAIDRGALPLSAVRRRRWMAGGPFILGVAALVVAVVGAQQLTPVMVELISISIHGASGNAASSGVAVNLDGSFVAFYSDATDLVLSDTNQVRDVFVRDRKQAVTERVSVSSDGEPGNRASHATGFPPAIDADGQIVAFYSDATNLVPDDTNGQPDVFVRLRSSATTERVSLGAGGAEGNGPSLNPSINGDGQLVAFQSRASNLVPNDQNGDVADIFVRDRSSSTTERVCDGIEPNGSSFAPSISANGRFVAFTSAATNLVPSTPDNNGQLDIFVCDRTTGVIDLVSVNTLGQQGNGDSILPAISEDGRFVAFKSLASNLVPDDHNNVVDVFVRDRENRTTERVSVNFLGGDANDASFPPSISYDGRFVAFGSAASNIVRADVNQIPSVFVRDRMFKLTLLVDVNARGEQANGATPDVPPSVSGDGRQIGYVSFASNLAGPDRNQTADVFIAGNPFFCPDDVCPPDLMCVNKMCVPEVVPTPTLGPSDCCQCAGNTCAVPSDGGCPIGCDPVPQAACLGTGSCATFTPSTGTATPTPTATGPTATPTGTPGANDCCQCEGDTCAVPTDGSCPTNCSLVRQAACLGTGSCATITPTPTVTGTATPGANDCCQCEGDTCVPPSAGTCPANCSPVLQAACLGTGSCATFTPVIETATPTPTATGPTVTPTATVGANDCCQCEGNTCAVATNGGCPEGCSPVRQAVCLGTSCATFTPVVATTTATATVTATATSKTPSATPTATLGANDCCQCGGNACAVPSSGGCPEGCNPVRQAACLNTGECATFTPVSGTATATPTASSSPTRTQTAVGTPTSTRTPAGTPVPGLDKDACQCAVSPSPQRTRRGVLLWLSGPVMLLLRRLRKRVTVRGLRRLLLSLFLMIAFTGPARAAGPFLGLDVGASEPTNGNYRANVRTGAAINPYLGYMFNKYLGVQGQIHVSVQSADFHSDFADNNNQTTTLLGGTAGPRLEMPFRYPFELGDGEIYATAQGGYFTGLSGRLSHSGAGFSAGAGIGYQITSTLTAEVFGRWNRAYMKPSPEDLGPGQVAVERIAKNIEWATGGLGLRYSFPEAPPPPPVPVVAEAPPPPPPVQKKIVLRNVLFDFDRSDIRPDSAPVLDEAIELLKEGGNITIVAEGHTDSIGTEAYNLKLSERRAASVRKYLVEHGISPERIRTEGFGEARPVATNDTPDGRAQNRRVELRVINQ